MSTMDTMDTMGSSSTKVCLLAHHLLQRAASAGAAVNVMKLAAVLYYCEAGSLAVFERALTDEALQAWDVGPMYPSLWAALGHKGWNDLEADALAALASQAAAGSAPDEEVLGLLEDVWCAYGEYSQAELDRMIRAEQPWKEARRGLQPWDLTRKPISRPLMASFYKTRFGEEAEAAVRPAAATFGQTA